MVKRQFKDNTVRGINQGKNGCPVRATKIWASTAYGYCSERLSPFGGLLGLVKFMDVVRFKEIFEGFYKATSRAPELGHYNMVYGIIMLLFIGFKQVIWGAEHIQILQLPSPPSNLLQYFGANLFFSLLFGNFYS